MCRNHRYILFHLFFFEKKSGLSLVFRSPVNYYISINSITFVKMSSRHCTDNRSLFLLRSVKKCVFLVNSVEKLSSEQKNEEEEENKQQRRKMKMEEKKKKCILNQQPKCDAMRCAAKQGNFWANGKKRNAIINNVSVRMELLTLSVLFLSSLSLSFSLWPFDWFCCLCLCAHFTFLFFLQLHLSPSLRS